MNSIGPSHLSSYESNPNSGTAYATIRAALKDPEKLGLRKLIPTTQRLKEIVKEMPEERGDLYFYYGHFLEEENELKGAVECYKEVAMTGHARAQGSLGFCYLTGLGVTLNVKEAFKWFLEAAKQGHARSQVNLGRIYEKGNGVDIDLDTAKHWYQKAADQNYDNGKKCLAKLIKEIDPVEISFREGYRFEKEGKFTEAYFAYKKAQEKDHIIARYKVGLFYLQGKGIEKSAKLAYQFFILGAKKGHLQSKFNLALMLEIGEGIAQDLVAARKWYKEAADKGYDLAISRLETLNSTTTETMTETIDFGTKTLDTICAGGNNKIWQIDSNQTPKMKKREYLIPASDLDRRKVIKSYQLSPVDGFEVGKVMVIDNPDLESAFASRLSLLETRHDKSNFQPNWDEESYVPYRKKTLKMYQEGKYSFIDEDYPHVTIHTAWHGTDPKFVESIAQGGFANLGTTDSGYYGKGYYFTPNSQYAHENYSKGILILSYVLTYSSYGIVGEDENKFVGKNAHSNFDSHIIGVNEVSKKVFHAPKRGQKFTYFELVTFEQASTRPCYTVELVPIMTKQIYPKTDAKEQPKTDAKEQPKKVKK